MPKVASRVVGSGLCGPLCVTCTHELGESGSWPTTVIEAFLEPTESGPGECLHVVLESSLPEGGEGGPFWEAECIQCTPKLRWEVSSGKPRMYCARSFNLRKWRWGYMRSHHTPSHE